MSNDAAVFGRVNRVSPGAFFPEAGMLTAAGYRARTLQALPEQARRADRPRKMAELTAPDAERAKRPTRSGAGEAKSFRGASQPHLELTRSERINRIGTGSRGVRPSPARVTAPLGRGCLSRPFLRVPGAVTLRKINQRKQPKRILIA